VHMKDHGAKTLAVPHGVSINNLFRHYGWWLFLRYVLYRPRSPCFPMRSGLCDGRLQAPAPRNLSAESAPSLDQATG
jgi:hypothetical protein